jgi:hypothetical protein
MTENVNCLPVMDTVKSAWDKVSGSKATFWKVLGTLFLVVIIFGGLSGGFKSAGMPGLSGLFHFIVTVLQALIGWSLIYIGIQRALGLPINFRMITYSLDFFIVLNMIGYTLLRVLILLPAGIVLGVGVACVNLHMSSIVQLIGVILILLSIVTLIYLSIRMWIGPAIILDKKLNAFQSLKLSFKATKGNVWCLIGILLMTIFIFIACAVTVGIGLIWGIPCLLILYGEVYKKLCVSRQ